jgi:hypothetical protein
MCPSVVLFNRQPSLHRVRNLISGSSSLLKHITVIHYVPQGQSKALADLQAQRVCVRPVQCRF